jgi:hypothetical protein
LKGFVYPGSCNAYVGVVLDGNLIGVFGFKIARLGFIIKDERILMNADTVKDGIPHGSDLMCLLLQTKEFESYLSDRFCLNNPFVITAVESKHPSVSRYRKYAEVLLKEKRGEFYHISYKFDLGIISTKKEAIARWRQKLK